MISFCLATRGRPQIFSRFYNSIMDTAKNPDRIEFITYHDDDDLTIKDYEVKPNITRIIGPRVPNHLMVNMCWKKARGDIFGHMADDFVFKTKNWDEAVKIAFDAYRDKIVLVWPNDNWYRSAFGTAFFLHRVWTNITGYLAAPYFVGQYVDNWWNEVSTLIHRRCFLRRVYVIHEYSDDQVHLDYITRSKAANSRQLFASDEMLKKRVEDAVKLLAFMEQCSSHGNYGVSEIGNNKRLTREEISKGVSFY